MGLDMYLTKRTYVKNWSFNKKKHQVSVKYDGKARKDINPRNIEAVIEDVMYWRKANAIHSWFVNNVQDGVDNCGEYYVSEDKLLELCDLCDEVVKTKDVELLKTQSGFFFGGTDYDDYYFDELKRTSKEIRNAIKELDKKPEKAYSGEFYYSSSW
jgi:hypothetical protein